MKRTALGLVLLASLAFAQRTRDKLTDDLRGISSLQIADDILALAEPGAEPSRRTVREFTDELTAAMIGKPSGAYIPQLRTAIVDVLHSNALPGWRYREAIESLRSRLAAMRVPYAEAQRVADRLKVVGQEVRGPDDLPVRNLPVLK